MLKAEIQEKLLLLEKQDRRRDVLLKDIAGLHAIEEDLNFDEKQSQDEEDTEYCDPEAEFEVVVTRRVLATRAGLGILSVLFADILKKVPDHGLEAR